MKKSILYFLNTIAVYCLSQSEQQSISFIENKGQLIDQFSKSRTDILYSGESNDLSFFFKRNGVSYQFSKVNTWKEKQDLKTKNTLKFPDEIAFSRLDISWLGANSNTEVKGKEPLNYYKNYFCGYLNNPVSEIRSFNEIIYSNIYYGIDIHYYSNSGSLKYDFELSPFADPNQIKIDIKGALTIYIDDNGRLVIETPIAKLVEEAPIAFQNNKAVTSKWLVNGNVVSFELGEYDRTKPLTIDPLIKTWGTYFGGNNYDVGESLAIDKAGNVIVTGFTQSTSNVATTGAYQVVYSGGTYDSYIMKFTSTGTQLWSTYYGGLNTDEAYSCVVDTIGNIYISGNTMSLNGISTPTSHQPTNISTYSGFFSKFSASGFLVWGTYYNYTGGPNPVTCCIDNIGNLYLTGSAGTITGTCVVTPGAHQVVANGSGDAFLAKFDPNGNRIWGTYFGGDYFEAGHCCTTDKVGNVFIAGHTNSINNLATPGCHQPNSSIGTDGFLAKFTTNGSLLWSTFYGGNGNTDEVNACATDNNHNVIITGRTNSSDAGTYASPGSHQQLLGGGVDAFLAKFDSSGVRLWGTYYGGEDTDGGYACPIDLAGNIFMAGEARSVIVNTAIATNGTYLFNHAGGWSDGFLTKITPNGVRHWGTYIGGSGMEWIASCANNGKGDLYVTAWTNSGFNISTPGSFQPNSTASTDGYLMDFNYCSSPLTLTVTSTESVICRGQTTILNASGANYYCWNNSIYSSSITVSPTVTTTYTLTGQDTIGCPTNFIFTQYVSECTGLKNQYSNEQVILFPIPFSNDLTIELSILTEQASLEIYNSLGILMKKCFIKTGKQTIDLKELPSGLYIAYINNKELKQTFKVIKE
jgi:hypothetical protein